MRGSVITHGKEMKGMAFVVEYSTLFYLFFILASLLKWHYFSVFYSSTHTLVEERYYQIVSDVLICLDSDGLK